MTDKKLAPEMVDRLRAEIEISQKWIEAVERARANGSTAGINDYIETKSRGRIELNTAILQSEGIAV